MKVIHPLPLLLAVLFLGSSAGRGDLTVASLSTITTDLAKNIGGTHVKIEAVIKPGIDPHEFEPTPSDVKKVADANLVLFTGKGIEGYLTKLEEAAGGGSSKFLDIGKDIPSLTMDEDGKKVEDPHWWHSVENMKMATRVVAAAFAKADPSNAASYQKNAQRYLASLDELQRWIRVKLAGLSHDQRKLVTSHDALQYFAHDYGFTIYPLKGVSTNEEPSSRHVREIIEVIRGEHVKAVFFESIENLRAIQQIADETGTKTGGSLYSDGLGETEANTYDSMMRHNVSAIVDGLK
jgi:zinc/manganese transport system substrate-binding protein